MNPPSEREDKLSALMRKAQEGDPIAHQSLSVAAFGALGTQLICQNDDLLHILLWHVIPVIAIGSAGAVLGQLLLRWERKQIAERYFPVCALCLYLPPAGNALNPHHSSR